MTYSEIGEYTEEEEKPAELTKVEGQLFYDGLPVFEIPRKGYDHLVDTLTWEGLQTIAFNGGFDYIIVTKVTDAVADDHVTIYEKD